MIPCRQMDRQDKANSLISQFCKHDCIREKQCTSPLTLLRDGNDKTQQAYHQSGEVCLLTYIHIYTQAFDSVPHGRLLNKIPNSGVDSKVVVWLREFLSGRMQSVRVEGQLSKEVKVTSGVLQGSVLGPLLFLAYVNDIWRNMESTIRLFADDCLIYRKIIKKEDMNKLQKGLDRLGEWVTENVTKINPSKSKAIRFMRARAENTLNYSLMDTVIPQANSCKYLGITMRSNLSWADQVNYMVKKAWKALHFTM